MELAMNGHRGESNGNGALAGVKVLDLSRVLAAPLAGQILGDLGAEVVKIERTDGGDPARAMGLDSKGGAQASRSPFFLACNRNKKSIMINFASNEGQEILRRLAMTADVLIENYIVGTLARHGLDYETLARINPRLIYCSVTGYGHTGPRAHQPGFDPVFQAETGVMSVTGDPEGCPTKTGVYLVDILGGYNAAVGILAALHERKLSGRGQHVDIGLFDCGLAGLATVGQTYLSTGRVPGRHGNTGISGGPSELFDCRDGQIYVLAGLNHHFQKLCDILGLPQLATEPRFSTSPDRYANRAELRQRLQAAVGTWSCDSLLNELSTAAIPAGRMNTVAEALSDKQVSARGMVIEMDDPSDGALRLLGSPIRLSRTPPSYVHVPPQLGQHGEDVLKTWLNLCDDEIAGLREAGAVAIALA